MQTKLRSDAWEAALTAETRQELYHLTKPRAEGEPEDRPWLRDFDRDVLPYLSIQGIVAPGRSSWYRFLGRMREEEAAKTIISVETSKRIAQGIQASGIDPQLAADVMTSLSVDEAAKPYEQRNEKVMQIFASAAAMFAGAAQRDRELALKADKGRRDEEALKLAREKFEFDAAKQAMAKAAEIKKISADDTLAADEKIARVRAALFGVEVSAAKNAKNAKEI